MKILDKNDQEKIKFDINLLDLTFLGEELYTTSILFYPIVIFEFMNGYYTTSGIDKKNNFLMDENVKNDENILKIGKYLSCPAENNHKEDFLKGFIEISKEEQNSNNSNIRMSVRPGLREKKINCYKFNDYFNVYIEKIIFFRDDVMKKKKVDLNIDI